MNPFNQRELRGAANGTEAAKVEAASSEAATSTSVSHVFSIFVILWLLKPVHEQHHQRREQQLEQQLQQQLQQQPQQQLRLPRSSW
ncbi:hypothetical protein ETH_00023360 [Eimeria tenella]|uniref:Uncharacterized protein n=1 Tax=Eimeria tenella TaxID=5802 RepID=U6LBT5_EIMTE|nr:hypothetical protein ETH_00023360 [Eimeria tenella]CDJ45220.1 hypothetical protein ETH_00023360 [Eimeria tenella]|eukprot:XP_013235967.1 hypothetical protein ETH_00023360 [Eimeria tenella]